MARNRSLSTLLAICLTVGAGASVMIADSPVASARTKAKPKKAKAATKAPAKPKAPPPISAAHKKALDELRGPYTFGMTKDQVLAALAKQLDESYADRVKATTDIRSQDRLRAEKKKELAEIKATYQEFDGKITGWDVSLIESEFGQKNGESMMVYWENEGGKNQRRFFFFTNGSLYKMYLSLDTSALTDDVRNFDAFKTAMEGRFGGGVVSDAGGTLAWTVGNYGVIAQDKLRRYDALCISLFDVSVAASVESTRTVRPGITQKVDSVTQGILSRDTELPPLDQSDHATAAVIKAAGGAPAPKTKPKAKQ